MPLFNMVCSQRIRYFLWTALTFGLGLFLINCEKPRYPMCASDDDCKEHNEMCVDKKCVECMTDSSCAEKLGEGATCQSGRCVAPKTSDACKQDKDCGAHAKCQQSRCVANTIATCKNNSDCGAEQECVSGACSAKVANLCRDLLKTDTTRDNSQVLFEYNKSDLTNDAQKILEQVASCLQNDKSQRLGLEGHTDERGTTEYNLSLGEQRAISVMNYLKKLGVEPARMNTASKGKNAPICQVSDESCYLKNRRVEFKPF